MFQGIDSNDVCNQGLDGTCDRTAFVDDIQIVTPEPSSVYLLFSGFLLGALMFRSKFAPCLCRVG